ncbi:unnamed protein product [Colias eurytheme]|nr:unnamed protein product [Colias eurytheme]
MNLLLHGLILLGSIYLNDAGYGIRQPELNPQSDVEAPAYLPANARNYEYEKTRYSPRNYGGTKTGYGGTKTGYGGTKTTYGGTKTGYGGTKTGYGGTKTGYGGTKTSRAGMSAYRSTKPYAGTKTGYSETRTWQAAASPPGYSQFVNHVKEPYKSQCEVECQNNGICIYTNTCECPPNFTGKYCEFEKKPCLVFPPIPKNSVRECSAELCTIQCLAHHKFLDGTTVANMRCVNGHWEPTRADLTSIPDCEPECSPPCGNGGRCIGFNNCFCTEAWRGPQCQYPVSKCAISKAHMIAYECVMSADTQTCRAWCPAGTVPRTPLAKEYTCHFATGVYEPELPHCELEEIVIVTPSNYHPNQYYSIYTPNSTESLTSPRPAIHPVVVVEDLTPKGGSCLTWAGVHYKTFDGKIYSFESPCQHILVRDAEEHKYTVFITHPECKGPFCPSIISVFLEDKEYMISASGDTVVFRNTKRVLPIPATLPGIRVSMPTDNLIVELDSLGVTIKWDLNNLVVVEGTAALWNKTEGLCGTLDGSLENDMMTKEKKEASTLSAMVSSWQVHKIGDVCTGSTRETNACLNTSDETKKQATQFCRKMFSKDKFRKCSEVMDVSQLLDACEWDYCACTKSQNPEECACKTVAVYAKECLRHGVEEMRSWRDAETCPMKCPAGKIYSACGPDAQPSCAFPTAGRNGSCVEGCFCPPGLLLERGACVQQEECPCRTRNKVFPPGATVRKSCNTCTCSSGEWQCTQAACGARCGAAGDPHYTTFDGLRYDFMGRCSYTLLAANNLTVNVDNVACSGAITEAMNLAPYKGEGKPSCTKAVDIEYNGVKIHMKQGGFILANGKEVSTLPVTVGDVRIRVASSLFVIVQLPIKVDIWWDGDTRVFVDVPPSFVDQTKGLCGTFNLNQKDDFLTPEGDVEQSAAAFANKWKTREFCDDTSTEEPEHPCTVNVENKGVAEQYCGKLKSSLFEACHWHVDVAPFYAACVYDMCACAGDAARCLCPALAGYADACARAGVMVYWRNDVKECELQCTGGQEYTVCADSCVRTCTDVALDAGNCHPQCVEGCACPAGQVLDDNNECVPIAKCGCYHSGLAYKAGQKLVRAGRRERELCTCAGARWECTPATPEDIAAYPPAEDLRSNCTSSNNMEFTTCLSAEAVTCKNMHLPPTTISGECRPGCRCKPGFVLDTSSDRCVLPVACPCHHGGTSYPDGHTMQEECNTCKCVSGKWSCTQQQCSGVCMSWGDSHMVSFDGTMFDFEGVCSYLLAKGTMDTEDGFSIEIQNVPCGTTGATCSKAITLSVGSGDSLETATLAKGAPLPDASSLKRIKLRTAGVYTFLDVPTAGLSVQWDRGLRAYVKLDPMWRNRVKGLCGNFNGDNRDDFQTPSGGGLAESSALLFADSWKLKPTCPKPQEMTDHCAERAHRKDWAFHTCGTLKRHPFTLCHSEVPVSPFVTRCAADACACDAGADCECACAALAAYAHACALRGVHLRWRTQELCPMQCDEECSNYSECMSACPPETCDNILDYADIKAVCEQETCVEGCKPNKTCPEGTVYSNSSLKECVPRNQCKPPCMTLEDGRVVLEGEVLAEDACHTCRCSKQRRVCTGLPCSTEMTTPGSTPIPETTPHDEAFRCKSGWSQWFNRGGPEKDSNQRSVEKEPLPKPNEFASGTPTCKKEDMTDIECRTVKDHKSAKETGLNVECSLEHGLLCDEAGECPDFEIRVLCKCAEEPFQCLNASHPNNPHPTDCSKFYECTPGLMSQVHAVEKSCPPGLMYHPGLMVCDWPAAVIAVRPECGQITTEEVTSPSSTSSTTSSGPCAPGEEFKCLYPCDQLCDHFKGQLQNQGQCLMGEVCVNGCVSKNANSTCAAGSMWRDTHTCVPVQDCTCNFKGRIVKVSVHVHARYIHAHIHTHTCVPVQDCTCNFKGRIVKPGGVIVDDCTKCQCLDNALHCDTSDCASTFIPIEGPTHATMIITDSHRKASTIQTSITTPTTPTTNATTPYTEPTPPIIAEITTTFAPKTTWTPSTAIPTTFVPHTASSTLPPLVIKSTVSPLPKCNPNNFKHLLWSPPEPVGVVTASSVFSPMFQPQFSMLDGPPTAESAGSWNPLVSDQNQYIQVELPERTAVYGVSLQGNPIFDQYVTSYDVMYGDDGHVFSPVEDLDGSPKVFRGPIDHKTPLDQIFDKPFEAKFVRIHPRTWHNEIAIRFDLIGCEEFTTTTSTTTTSTTTTSTTTTTTTTPEPTTVTTPIIVTIPSTLAYTTEEPMQCTEPLGLGADLPVEMIEVSSNNDDRPYLKLDSERGWRPLYSTPGEWIMFNFTSPRNITGIKTKGGPTGYVTTYNIMYTSDLSIFNPMLDQNGFPRMFPGNFDSSSVVMNEFRPPLHAQYLKLLPIKWDRALEISVEPIGCFEPYPVRVPPADERAPTPSPCALCPGVPLRECACTAPLHYDGDSCVPRDQCPCMILFFTYPVGSKFRDEKCRECVCKLGGITDCKPAVDCQCAPDLVPRITDDCECLCEPCTNGTKICPTSKLCLPLDKWCDGLQDCPDDEKDCLTTTLMPVPETVITTVMATVANTPPTTKVTTPAPTTTTEKPFECPKAECPAGYTIHKVNSNAGNKPGYSRYKYNGGYSKGGYAKGGYAKGGYSKGGRYSRPQKNVFSLNKPVTTGPGSTKRECEQFKCIPPMFKPSRPPGAPPPCAAPACPPKYMLRLDTKRLNEECPQYVCEPPPEQMHWCNMTGRTFNTFDGLEYKYDVCHHILARDNRLDSWAVLARKRCTVDGGCKNELIVNQDEEIITVRPDFIIQYDNYEYTVEQTQKICFQKNSFKVSQLGTGLEIRSLRYGFVVTYTQDGDIKIGLGEQWKNSADGLCGAFDGRLENERRLPGGKTATSTEQFARAWRRPGQEPPACREIVPPRPSDQQRAWDLCKVITQEPLSRCAKVLNLDKWRDICLEKICECTEMIVNGTKNTGEQCRCQLLDQLVAECLAADANIDLEDWRIQNNCPAECPPPLRHHDCYRKRCEPACGPLYSGLAACPPAPGACFPGCFCPEGTLRRGDQCVLPHDCVDCVCKGTGTPAKYVTFEDDYLPHLGNCTYLVSRDLNENGEHKYQIYATNGPCEENPEAACVKIVHLIHGNNTIRISKDPATKKLVTLVNGNQVFRYPLDNEWALVSMMFGQDVSVVLPDLYLELQVKQEKMEILVQVPSHVYAHRTEGLCGVCSSDRPQLTTSKGEPTEDLLAYGASWQASPEALTTLGEAPEQCGEQKQTRCEPPPPDRNPCLQIQNADKFGACHALIEPKDYVEKCEAELCELNTTDACTVLARYAADCRAQGVCLTWRDEICPLPCEEPFVYRPCVDCERTCENHEDLEKNPKKCTNQPVEGCFCPEGKVRVNNTCIEPAKCFPCDSKSEHYAGDEWQEDACTKCTCSKVEGKNLAHVACTTQTCTVPMCSENENLIKKPTKHSACCPKYMCLPKPKKNKPNCKEPKKMECGFGQVLKQKTNAEGCSEFTCECMPANECQPIPSDNEVEMLEPGMERVIDQSGCCPKVELVCHPKNCPKAPDCPKFYKLETVNTTEKCCPEYKCELPKDKCNVTLEWEAAATGGEKMRANPQVMLKDIDAVWADGPCRACHCAGDTAQAAHAQCTVEECPAIVSDAQFVRTAKPVPFECCPRTVSTACRSGDHIYQIGETWKSPDNACESYLCKEVGDGELEVVTTVQTCDTTCQPGWQYEPANSSVQCCGRCKPVACVVNGQVHNISTSWTSDDFCANYTCVDLNGTLQVQSSNETCPEIPEPMLKQFVFSDEKIPGKCCPKREPIACRVGNEIYQEGQTWPTSDPCKNVSCTRDSSGRLAQVDSIESCAQDCKRGWGYEPAPAGQCCGHCAQQQCVLGDVLREPGSTWKSMDNCTTYTCEKSEGEVFVTSSRQQCIDISDCPEEDRIMEDCCLTCKRKTMDLKTCTVKEREVGVGELHMRSGARGDCVNVLPVRIRECQGHCESGTFYSNQTGKHTSECECCTASRVEPLGVELVCADGRRARGSLASPAACACRACADTRSPLSGTKTNVIPEFYKRSFPPEQ